MGLKEALLFVALSLIQTDWYQSVPILPYTEERPLYMQNGAVWEANEFVAGDPQAARNMTEWAMQLHEVSPDWLGAALIAQRAIAVVSNDRKLGIVGLPRCYMIGYRWRF